MAAKSEQQHLEQQLSRIAHADVPRVLMISHGIGGGVARHINELVDVLQGQAHVLLLEPVPGRRRLRLTLPELNANGSAATASGAPLSLAYRWPAEAEMFWQLLAWLGVSRVHIHHVQGFSRSFWPQLQRQGLRYDLTLHDHSIFTGHASLVDAQGVFEPRWLKQSVLSLPRGYQHIADSLQSLALSAQRVIVPSAQLEQAVKHLLPKLSQGINLMHRAHPDAECARAYPQPYLRPLGEAEPLRVLCLGMLSIEKGAGVLAQVAEHAQHSAAPLQFVLLGSCHVPLPAAVQRLGSYADAEVQQWIAQIDPHVAWLPAQCPETWSYTLSAAFKAGLPVLTSDLGVFPERLQGRPLSWWCAHRAGAGQWLKELLKIREQHLRGTAPSFWSWLPPPPFYSAAGVKPSATDPLRAAYSVALGVPQSSSGQPPQLAQSIDVARRRAKQGTAKWRTFLLAALSALRNSGWLTPLVRVIPYRWQQKIKRMISREPLAEPHKKSSRSK